MTATRVTGRDEGSSSRTTWVYSLLIALAVLVGGISSAHAGGNARIVHTIVKKKMVPPQMGRDLWFTMIKNYDDQSGKYYNLYVTSPNQTNIYVNMANQATKVLPVQPYSVASFNIPLGWEIKTSAILEHKAIHVWSNDGDICAYLMSHNPYTSDGMYIIPAIGWGTENVVAAYNALFEGFGTYVYDFPSEMAIIANQDNTICTITPSTDIRVESAPHACKTCVAHPKGIPFVEILNKGDAIQYLSLTAADAENFDMTGTVVKSNVPVGIVGGSMCPNIPMGYPYCDHVCEMIPPVRTWATTYISAPFYPANPGKQWSSFLVIGTKPNQIIYREDPTYPKSVYCILGSQYSTYLRDDIDQASSWTSDDPFLLVQYINSSTYPDGANAQGDPAEVVINPVEQWTKTVVFQTPVSIGNQSPYKNYVNILVDNNAIKSTKFDDQGIANYTHLPVNSQYSVYRVSGVKAGAHKVISDSGVGVYIYGYGYDESYGWAGSFGTGTFRSPDTIPPAVIPNGECFAAHVDLSDSGLNQSKLGYIRLDTIYNMAYSKDDPNWAEGVGKNSSFYDMYVLDSTKEAILEIAIFDIAGNESIITSTYQPQFAAIVPPARDFGIGNLGGAPVYQYDTIINLGKKQFSFTDLKLLNPGYGNGKSGFMIDSAVVTPLAVGETRIIKLSFIPQQSSTSFDTVVFGDPCLQQKVIVYGTGGGGDFRITDYDFGTVPIVDPTNTAGASHKSDPAAKPGTPGTHIVNMSKLLPLVIDSVWTDDPHFVADPTLSMPLTIPAAGDLAIECTFTPTAVGQVKAPWHARATSVGDDGKPLGVRNATLKGNAAMAGQQLFRDTEIVMLCVAAGDSAHIVDTLLATGTLGSDVTSIVHTAATDPMWSGFEVFTQNGSIADFTKNPEHLSTNELLIVVEDFHPVPGVTKAYYDTITATTATGEIMRVRAKIQTIFRQATVNPAAIEFPAVPYKGTAPATSSFSIQNTADTDLTVTTVAFPTPASKYDAAFKLTPSQPLPVTLQPGQSLKVNVDFDPSFSYDSAQHTQILIESNECGTQGPIGILAHATVGGATISGYAATPILSCSQQNGIVPVTNTMPSTPAGLTETITSVQIVGPDAALFSLASNNYVGTVIPAGSAAPIGVVFNPSTAAPSIASAQTYNASVKVHLTTNRLAPSMTDTDMTQQIQGIAQGVMVAASSNFATSANIQNGNQAAASNTALVSMPVSTVVTGLGAQLPTLNVDGVQLTYLFNTDLLDIMGGIANAFVGQNGWTIDASKTVVANDVRRKNPAPGIAYVDTLYLVLKGSKVLDVTMPTLGSLNFRVTLANQNANTDVTLASMQLTSTGNAVGPCVGTQVVGGNFSIIYRCGNQILMDFMNGNSNFLFSKPAVPNPATGGHITIAYANRGETVLTMTFTDELGNEVMRPLDNVRHEAGSWQITSDVSKLPSGNYTYRLTDGHHTISKQFVIQK